MQSPNDHTDVSVHSVEPSRDPRNLPVQGQAGEQPAMRSLKWWLWCLAVTVAIVFTLCFVLFADLKVGGRSRGVAVGLLIAWAIVPPLWFLYEYQSYAKKMSSDEFARFKHSQDLARNLWVAVFTVAALIFNARIK